MVATDSISISWVQVPNLLPNIHSTFKLMPISQIRKQYHSIVLCISLSFHISPLYEFPVYVFCHFNLSWFFKVYVAAAAKSLQSCPTLCNPIHSSPPGSPVPGILQAWTLEWVAISFSNAWKWKVKVKSLSCVRLFVTAWTAAYQAPPSMGFSRQGYWSGLPLPSWLKMYSVR